AAGVGLAGDAERAVALTVDGGPTHEDDALAVLGVRRLLVPRLRRQLGRRLGDDAVQPLGDRAVGIGHLGDRLRALRGLALGLRRLRVGHPRLPLVPSIGATIVACTTPATGTTTTPTTRKGSGGGSGRPSS